MRFTTPVLLGSFLALAGCSSPFEVRVHNATRSSLTVAVRVDRVGSDGESLDQLTLKPSQLGTLGPVTPPPLEFIELVITRPGDIANVPTTLRIPRKDSAWTISPDSDAWTGYAIVEGVTEPQSTTHD